MRYALLVLFALVIRPATAACDARTVKELRTVFTVAAGLHDALRNAGGEVGAAQIAELRAKLDDYDAQRTLPCAAVAAELLAKVPDTVLGQTLLRLATRPPLMQSEALPRSLAQFLGAQPEGFQQALASLPADDRCALAASLETGWPGLRGAVAADRAATSDAVVANLKRVNCRPPEPKPASETPDNPTRDRSVREPRASRPRWA